MRQLSRSVVSTSLQVGKQIGGAGVWRALAGSGGSEGAGTVVALGDGVTGFGVGDRVATAAATGDARQAWIGFSMHPLVDSPRLGRALLDRAWVCDVPPAGRRHARGDPVCTVLAQGPSAEAVLRALDSRRCALLEALGTGVLRTIGADTLEGDAQ